MVIEENHVEIAGVVHLAATELAHGEHDRAGGPTIGRLGPPEPLSQRFYLDRHDLLHERLGDAGERGRRGLGILPAQHVANTHPELLRRFESLQHWLDVYRPATEFGETRLE